MTSARQQQHQASPSCTSTSQHLQHPKMPRLDENTQGYLHDAEHGVRQGTSRAWDSFSNFALRDNVLEVAVGLMYTPPLPYIPTHLTRTPQPGRLLHRMRQLPRLRHNPPANLPPPLPLPQPRREIRHPQARPQLQRHGIQRIQHRPCRARRRRRGICVRQLLRQDCAVCVHCAGAVGHCVGVLAWHG
jgi:hypothetical protein